MRKIIYTILTCGLFGLVSCNSFLDVQPKGTVEQDKQFADLQGCMDAMYGVYASMASVSLYGQALSWGFVDWIAQLSYDKYGSYPEVWYANQYDYEHQNVRPMIDAIWSDAYKCISYVNNILENVKEQPGETNLDYSLIRGEAYAIRAFLHFDILRLFADNYLLSPEAGGIPYATTFDLNNKPVYSLKEVYDRIIADLDQAERLLEKDVEMDDVNASSEYREKRWMHCNKYAVWGIKARVYHYKGELDSAAVYARKVIESPVFSLIPKGSYISKKLYRFSLSSMNGETLWGLYTKNFYDNYRKLFLDGSVAMGNILCVREDVRSIYEAQSFDADSKDDRFEVFFSTDMYDSRLYNFKRLLTLNETANNINGVCLIRLPEMYYILAEALYQTNKEQAVRYFNDVRNSRGLRDIESTRVATWELFKNELLNERRKEFWGEGQCFFTYKRENMAIIDGTTQQNVFQPSPEIYILPWPEAEKEFGITSKN